MMFGEIGDDARYALIKLTLDAWFRFDDELTLEATGAWLEEVAGKRRPFQTDPLGILTEEEVVVSRGGGEC